MLLTNRINKTLLATSIAALLSLASGSALAEDAEGANKIYVDPVTGEVKEAPKLLSEMTAEEKAKLSDEEYKSLKGIEAQLKEQMEEAELDNSGG